MADKTGISWSDATWNPIIGCTKVSPGCDHCYPIPLSRIREKNPNPKVAAAFAGVVGQTESGLDWTGRVNLLHDRLTQPLRWRKPRRVFVNSLADLFHDQVPDDFIAQVFAVMALAKQHTFQVLTKRHARMRSLLNNGFFVAKVWLEVDKRAPGVGAQAVQMWPSMPLPNVWMGVSVENQQWADIRIPALLETPAAVRFLSCEPLLGPVDLRNLKIRNRVVDCLGGDVSDPADGSVLFGTPSVIDWVICGGESGPGARPMHPKWPCDLRDQCQQAGVAYHFKQWGEWRPQPRYSTDDRHHLVMLNGTDRGTPWPGWGLDQPEAEVMERVGKKRAGRLLDGREWDEFPDTKTLEVASHG